jgi:hypothetical protein
MWLYRRRWKNLSVKEQANFEQLFDANPDVELPHPVREAVAETQRKPRWGFLGPRGFRWPDLPRPV